MSALGQKQISTSMEFGPLSAISRHSCLRHNRGERSFAHDAPEGAALLRLLAQQLRGRGCCSWRRLRLNLSAALGT